MINSYVLLPTVCLTDSTSVYLGVVIVINRLVTCLVVELILELNGLPMLTK